MHEVSTLSGRCPGSHSYTLMPALFHLPAMPFPTLIRLENSYASFKTSSDSIPMDTPIP